MQRFPIHKARAPPKPWAPAGAVSPAEGTLETLILPPQRLLALSALLTGVLQLEDLSAESPGLLLRGVQQGLGLLLLLPPVGKGLVRVLQLLVQRSCCRAGLPKVRQGIPKLKLQLVPGPLQGCIPGIGFLCGFSSLL